MRATIAVGLLTAFASFAPLAPASAQEAPPAAEASAQVAPEEKDAEARTLADWFQMGGWVMYLLVLTSILSFIVIMERLWSTRTGAVLPRSFLRDFRDAARDADVKGVADLCSASRSASARVLRAGIVHLDHGLPAMEDSVGASMEHESTVLRRNLALLAALGNMATMLGLLGTVLGMIESFDLIAKTGTGDARVVAGGIFQALVTTAAGLMVGLGAIGAHSYLRRRAESLEIELSEKSSRMLEDLWIACGNGSIARPPVDDEDKDPQEV